MITVTSVSLSQNKMPLNKKNTILTASDNVALLSDAYAHVQTILEL